MLFLSFQFRYKRFALVLICAYMATSCSLNGAPSSANSAPPKSHVESQSAASTEGRESKTEQQEPHLLLISIDGLGWDVVDRAPTPALDYIAQHGIQAESLRPVFPTMTFPNHYSIATGLHPYQHGIMDNNFPSKDRSAWYRLSDRSAVQDGTWYGGEPIWVSAEKQGIISATYYFVGSEAAIQGISPTHWRLFDNTVPGQKRVDQVVEWLSLPKVDRPRMVGLYFEDVDVAAHRFGPNSKQAQNALAGVDRYLQSLLSSIEKLEINSNTYIIIVSDHGQADHRSVADAFVLDQYISLEGLTVVDHQAFAALYLDAPDLKKAEQIRDKINQHWRHGKAYLRNQAPAHWRLTDDTRFADIYLMADGGHAVISNTSRADRVAGGDHGWDPSFKPMHGALFAMGPRLPKGEKVGEISNLEIYPLMMEILGLPLPDNIEADDNQLIPLLSPSFD